MNSRRVRWPLVAVVVLVAAGIAFAVLDPAARVRGWLTGQPFYQGRAASAWEADLHSSDEVKAAAARDALAAGKGEAVPVCVWVLEHAGEPEARGRAADALKQMGKDAKPAGPAVLAALSDPDPLVRGVAAQAAEELAPDLPDGAVPKLVAAFPSVPAIRAVAKYGARGSEAVPKLVGLLKSEDTAVRRQAVRALGKIGEPSLPAVPEVIKLVGSDPVAGVREQSAEALGQIGPAAKEGIPTLVKALKDPEAMVRRDAVRSLGQMGPAARAALPDVKAVAAKKDEDKRVADAATAAIKAIESGDKSGVPPEKGE
jgi:HEAT repeat protein